MITKSNLLLIILTSLLLHTRPINTLHYNNHRNHHHRYPACLEVINIITFNVKLSMLQSFPLCISSQLHNAGNSKGIIMVYCLHHNGIADLPKRLIWGIPNMPS